MQQKYPSRQAIMWRTTREHFDGYQRETCSQIHGIYQGQTTYCGLIVDPEYMKAMGQDCIWAITWVEVYDYPIESVTCRRCKKSM